MKFFEDRKIKNVVFFGSLRFRQPGGCLVMFSLGSAVARAPVVGEVTTATVQLHAKQV